MATALLIDDDPARRSTLRAALADADLTLLAEGPARDVAELARRLRPNLVLLPMTPGALDVPATCRDLRDDPACAGAAIALVTAGRAGDDDEAARVATALAAGADDVLAIDEAPAVASARLRRLILGHQLAALAVLNGQLAQVGRLVAGIVHEIRAPLTVIRGNAELMALELGPDHPAGIWFRPILRNAWTLQTRLEHLMAAIRVGPNDPRPLDVVPVVRESISLFEKGVDAGRGRVAIELVLDPADGPIPPVRIDPGRLMQVVLNLLGNAHDAILAERGDGHVEVRVRPERAEGEVQIDIRDDGPGVDDGFLERIFEPFFTTKAGGTGYGLYLAAQILREHGGRLDACNHDGGGACFSIHLPAAPAPGRVAALDG